jgi:YopX protein
MIDIEFKAKSITTGEWVYSMTISKGNIKRKRDKYFFEIGDNKWVGVIPETIGQYTGEVDKSNNRIYRGDLLLLDVDDGREHQRIWEVVFKEGMWLAVTGAITANRTLALYRLKNMSGDFKVIGNIHDKTK